MLTLVTRPVRLALRASASTRARSAAPVSDVWDILVHPGRWAEFDPFVESVALLPAAEPASEPASESASESFAAEFTADQHVAVGQQLRARVRLIPLRVAMEVDHVVNRSSLATTARLLPGLAEEVEHLVIPLASGGSLLTVRFTLHGPLALPALVPRWLVRALTVRLLARAAEGSLREQAPGVPSVA